MFRRSKLSGVGCAEFAHHVMHCFGQPAASDVEGAMLSSYTDEEKELIRSINGKLKAAMYFA